MGPMFAGKTTALLRRVREEQDAGRSVVVVKSSVDTRYSVDHVVSHTGDRLPALGLTRLADLPQRMGEAAFGATDVIAVDESQFLEDLEDSVMQLVEVHRKRVLVAGLNGDFRRKRFGKLLDLMTVADSVELLSGHCQCCRNDHGVTRPSRFTLRIAAAEQQELVGGAEAYAPVCRECYVRLTSVRGEGAGAEGEGEQA